MKQKAKRHPVFWVITGVAAVLILLVVAVIINLPKHQSVSDSSFDLNSLADGVYQGECVNGLVAVKLEVEVLDHTIADVRITEHRNGMGKAAEEIVNSVISSRSIEVDAVAGATHSSGTILKAIENALSAE